MTSADLHTLTGAYALHALLDDEREEFERHLAACPSCTQEVSELAATAGRLGLAMTTTPPAALKTNVLRRITTVRQEPPPTTPVLPVAARAGRRRALARFALAACLAAALGSGGIAIWQHQQAVTARGQAETEQQKSRRLADVLAAPDAKVTTGHLEDNATGTLVVTRSRNQAAFLASGLPRPPSGKVYQLWYDDSGTMRSAGLLNSARTSDAVLLTGPLDQASAMGITVEPTGGSTRPTSAPLALMPIPRA